MSQDEPILVVCTTTRHERAKRRLLIWALIVAGVVSAALLVPTPWYAGALDQVDGGARQYEAATHLSAVACREWPSLAPEVQRRMATLAIVTARHASGAQAAHDFTPPSDAETETLRSGIAAVCAEGAPSDPVIVRAIDAYMER